MFVAISRYLLTLCVFFAIDMVWLGLIADDMYQQFIGHLLGPVNWGAALLFYLVYIGGIVYFAIWPALSTSRGAVKSAAIRGGVLGFVAYATYDLTNLATLKGWPVEMVVIDLLWGTVLTALVAAISCYLWEQIGLAQATDTGNQNL